MKIFRFKSVIPARAPVIPARAPVIPARASVIGAGVRYFSDIHQQPNAKCCLKLRKVSY